MKKRVSKLFGWSSFPALLLLAVFGLINAFVMPDGLSQSFVESFLNSNLPLICVCVGASAVLISGGTDISSGALVSLLNVLVATLCQKGLPWYLVVSITIGCSIVAGMLNGFLVSIMRITPLLTTFATSAVFSGLALIIMPAPGGTVSSELIDVFYKRFLGIPLSFVYVVILIVIWELYRHSPHGIRLYAAGQDDRKAYASGVNVVGERMFIYGFAGLTCGIGAIALSSSIGAGDPLIGTSYTMTVISAAVIGGVSLSGGKGDIWGGIFGCLFLGLITAIIVSMRIDSFLQEFICGIVLLAGVLFTVARGELKHLTRKIRKEAR